MRQIITTVVTATWEGYRTGSIYQKPKWTVGLLKKIVDEMTEAGFDEHTEVTPRVENLDGAGKALVAFSFVRSDNVETVYEGPDPELPYDAPGDEVATTND